MTVLPHDYIIGVLDSSALISQSQNPRITVLSRERAPLDALAKSFGGSVSGPRNDGVSRWRWLLASPVACGRLLGYWKDHGTQREAELDAALIFFARPASDRTVALVLSATMRIGPATVTRIAGEAQVSVPVARRALNRLVHAGDVTRLPYTRFNGDEGYRYESAGT